jgi:hypothetical protein
MRPVGCVPEAVEMAAKAQQLHDGVEVHAHGGGGVTTAR